MSKPHITATDLYNFRVCRYRPFMDYNGDSVSLFVGEAEERVV